MSDHQLPRLRARGFTILELMITIAIVLMLAGLVLAVMGMLKRQQQRVATTRIIEQVTSALTLYLSDYPVLGDSPTSADFIASPWTFLARNPPTIGKTPYLELPLNRLASGSGPYANAATSSTADQICDAFSGDPETSRLRFTITNGSRAIPGGLPRYYVNSVVVTSVAGTPAKTQDDIVFTYTSSTGTWERTN